MSAKCDASEVVTIDSFRNRSAKIRRAEPRLLVVRQWRLRHLVEPHELRVQRNSRIVHQRRILRGQLVEALRIDGVDEMNFATGQAKKLGVAVLLDVESYRVDVGQAAAGRVLPPVIWIAL